jgi:iron-sulfur cluster assembly accessory protein
MTETATSDVVLTDRAAIRVARILKTEQPGSALRIAVNGGGCSGFQYSFDIVQDRADDDLTLAKEGATVLIDPVSLEYMKGCRIDFVDDLIGQSFKIDNPNATASCGCGTSFSV